MAEAPFVAVPGSRTPIAAHVASETAYHDEFWPVRGLVTVAVLAYCRQVSDGSDEKEGFVSRLSNLLRQLETQDLQLAADLKRELEALSGRPKLD